jgi:hypothetical protein
MRCYACEQINNDHSRFCSECGASLTPVVWSPPQVIDPQQAQAPAQPAMAMPAAQPFRQPVYAPPAPTVQPGQAYGAYGYAPYVAAPPATPLINNNVTVTQAPPYAAPPPPMPAVVMTTRRPGALTIFLATLVLTSLGIFAGALWAAASSSGSTASSVAAVVTLLVFAATFFILERLARH